MIKRNEDAVSPVVGVMLMLVVTIIIAAVVSGFAGGLANGKEKAPQAAFECRISESGMGGAYGYEFSLKHLSGDPINTHDIKLVTSWVDADGNFHVQNTVAPTWVEVEEDYYVQSTVTNSSHYNQTSLNTHYTTTDGERYYQAPYKVNTIDTPADNDGEEETLWFGNFIMRAGDIAKATTNLNPGNGTWENQADPIIKDCNNLTSNTIVNVKLIDLKSGSTIYSKDIVMEA